jgi:hypothetical protein
MPVFPGYIGYDNILHLNPGADPTPWTKYTIGNSGITVGQALSGTDLSAWNRPQKLNWSFDNLLENLKGGDLTKYFLIGGAVLVAVAVLK